MTDLPFSCRCGQVKGTLHDARPNTGTHVRCFCSSCRAAMIHTGDPDPGDQGVTLFQTTPDKISFQHGQDRLPVFSFGPKNILRWQASCCNAALFTTLRSPNLPLAALLTRRLADATAIGPVKAQAFVPEPDGTRQHQGRMALFGGVLWRGLIARLTGRWKSTPFFDIKTRMPTAPVTVLPQETRRNLIG
ncbi:DUF6151 family protein [Sulfitobacter mediterraneus]|uniref:DUF6151 family protein n=1 Tax=Sulfitobacter mediterraneus TaxID=83219 RepID=UPI001EEE5EC9|nr:DUF6151 family protein [Sulfitobacter mediterraneus]